MFRNDSRFRVLVAGRRWGKTWLAMAVLLSWIAESKRADARIGYVAPTYKEARLILWDALKHQVPQDWLSKPPNESRLELDFVNGARLHLLGAEKPDNLRGPGWDGLILDEYATMKSEAWDVLRPALSDRKGVALFIGTPQSYNHLHGLWLRGQSHDADDADWSSWQFRTIDAAAPMGHIDPVEIESARRDLDPRTFRQEYEASFESLSGRVYYGFSRDVHAKTPIVIDPRDTVRVSFDFNINPATAVIGVVRGETVCVWREVYLKHLGGEATKSSARAVKALLSSVGHRGAVRVYGDSTGKAGKTTGPSDHQVLRDEFPGGVFDIPSAQPHVRDRIAAVNSRLESSTGVRRCLIDPSCVRLIADLEQVRFDDAGEIEKDENPELTHVSDAFGYWVVREFPVIRCGTVAFA